MRVTEGRKLDIFVEAVCTSTKMSTIDHYRLVELSDGIRKTARTKAVYKSHLDSFIVAAKRLAHKPKARVLAIY